MDELKLKAIWNEEAAHIKTVKDLTDFINRLSIYNHDYGTIVRAMGAAMSATFNVMNNSSRGGITGFQAQCLMWVMIDRFGMYPDGAPKRIICYDDLLYPQGEDKFTTIPKSVLDWAQKKAEKELEKNTSAVEEVTGHWKFLAAGGVPFGLKIEEKD